MRGVEGSSERMVKMMRLSTAVSNATYEGARDVVRASTYVDAVHWCAALRQGNHSQRHRKADDETVELSIPAEKKDAALIARRPMEARGFEPRSEKRFTTAS